MLDFDDDQREILTNREILTSRAVNLFLGVSGSEIEIVMNAAKTRLAKKAAEAENRERLDALKRQVKFLLANGYPEAAGMPENQFSAFAYNLANSFKIGDLIVIPRSFISIAKQMSMVTLDGKPGFTYLSRDVLLQPARIEIPNVPYLIRDVMLRGTTNNIGAVEYIKQIAEGLRGALTSEEGIAAIRRNPEDLRGHTIVLGERYGSETAFMKFFDGKPILCTMSGKINPAAVASCVRIRA